jgi:hypothetical protein
MVARCEAIAPPAAVAVPVVVTGGQTAAQLAEHAEADPLSASNRYTVILFGPTASTVPIAACLVVKDTALAAPAVVEAPAPDAECDPYGEVVAAAAEPPAALEVVVVLDAPVVLVDLLLLPQPASRTNAAAAAPSISEPLIVTSKSSGFRCPMPIDPTTRRSFPSAAHGSV